MIEKLLSPEVQEFIQKHLAEDPSLLMLQSKKYAHLPLRDIAFQIKSRQKLKEKLPEWVQAKAVIFPPAVSLEQASSQKTAEYKSKLLSGRKLVDLTGGMGVDSLYLSKSFKEVIYVEANSNLFEYSRHNLTVLGAQNISFFNQSAETFLKNDFKADCIFIDPDRRGYHNRKLVLLNDCEPDVLSLLPIMLDKSDRICIKTSPMLDITEATRSLKFVEQVHVISVDNEVKEVLYVIKKDIQGDIVVTTVNLRENCQNQVFSFSANDENGLIVDHSLPLKYLYEPNAAILKAGAFKSVGFTYGVRKLHANSHLYTSIHKIDDFPGRIFEIIGISAFRKKSLLELVPSKKANITTRNFPYSVDEIRKKTGIKDGGENFIFATTDLNGKFVLILCKKAEIL